MEDKFLNTTELAKIYNVHRSTIYVYLGRSDFAKFITKIKSKRGIVFLYTPEMKDLLRERFQRTEY